MNILHPEQLSTGRKSQKRKAERVARAARPPTRSGSGGPMGRSFTVLETIAQMRRPLGISELSAIANVPKPTMHRLVRQLENDRLLQRELRGRLRGPGLRLLDFALDVIQCWAEMAPRQALLQALSSKVGETCNLGIMAENAIIYIDRVEAEWPFGLRFEAGSKVPLHCTSMGKLFLSALAPHKRSELLQSLPLHRYTENTICDIDALERELVEIQRRTYSIDNQEFLAGVLCLAVPVRGSGGRLCAGLAISAPVARLSIEKALQCVPAMMETAQKLGEHLRRHDDDGEAAPRED